jgi:hypothetical protein
VISGAIGGVQTKIKDTYKHAHFVHCYAHQLNLIMQKATNQNPSDFFFQICPPFRFFFLIQHTDVKCDKSVTCRDAYGLRRALEDQNFIFWLTLFHKIFPHVETLFNQFQNRKKMACNY